MGNKQKILVAIIRRELQELFSDPMLYILTTIFSFIIGWVFYSLLSNSKFMTDTSMTNSILKPLLGYMSFLLMMFIPILSMKSFASEFKDSTFTLYIMHRVSWWKLYLGKFIALSVAGLFLILPSVIFPIQLAFSGYSDWGVVGANYIGIILTLLSYLSVGMFASSLTENVIIAVVLSFSFLFGSVLLAMSASIIDNYLIAQMVGYLSFISHLQGFEAGLIRNYDIVFYFSVMVFFCYLTLRSLDMRKL